MIWSFTNRWSFQFINSVHAWTDDTAGDCSFSTDVLHRVHRASAIHRRPDYRDRKIQKTKRVQRFNFSSCRMCVVQGNIQSPPASLLHFTSPLCRSTLKQETDIRLNVQYTHTHTYTIYEIKFLHLNSTDLLLRAWNVRLVLDIGFDMILGRSSQFF